MSLVLIPTASPVGYTATAAEVLSRARILLNDLGVDEVGGTPDPQLFRNSDAELLTWASDALSAALKLNPSLFVKVDQHVCTAGHYQTLSFARAVSMDVVVGMPVADEAALTRFAPGWQDGPPGPAVNWMPVSGTPKSFMLYPPSPSQQVLPVRFIQAHAPLATTTDVVELPESYIPALADYVVAQAEAKDDEPVNNNRVQVMLSNFAMKIQGAPHAEVPK